MIAVGVDTHKHEHVARALDGLGQLVGGLQIKANLGGYVELLGWLRSFDDDVVVGIEGAGSYGAGLCELLLGGCPSFCVLGRGDWVHVSVGQSVSEVDLECCECGCPGAGGPPFRFGSF